MNFFFKFLSTLLTLVAIYFHFELNLGVSIIMIWFFSISKNCNVWSVNGLTTYSWLFFTSLLYWLPDAPLFYINNNCDWLGHSKRSNLLFLSQYTNILFRAWAITPSRVLNTFNKILCAAPVTFLLPRYLFLVIYCYRETSIYIGRLIGKHLSELLVWYLYITDISKSNISYLWHQARDPPFAD